MRYALAALLVAGALPALAGDFDIWKFRDGCTQQRIGTRRQCECMAVFFANARPVETEAELSDLVDAAAAACGVDFNQPAPAEGTVEL